MSSTRSAIETTESEAEKIVEKEIRPVARTAFVAGAAVYAAMYVALVFLFNPISYGPVNIRVANILVGLVPLLGWSGIVGQTVGVFLANSVSPLGTVDLINVIPSFVFSWVIWRTRNTSVLLGLVAYSLALGVTVSLALNYAFGLPFLVEFPLVTAGILLATGGFGYMLYRAVRRLGLLKVNPA